MSLTQLLLVVLAALVGGVMNSIAGGGSLITFPLLVAIGLPSVAANVPWPRRPYASPSRSSSRYACCTVFGFTRSS
mgnify:CR=1 FL=1